MDSTIRHQRARALLSAGRTDLACAEYRMILTEAPQDAHAHACLSICLSNLEKLEEATDHAKQAIASDPNMDLGYYALGWSLFVRHRLKEALEPALQAVALDHTSSMNQGLLSQIYYGLEKWPKSLEAAEAGLQYDPEDEICGNLRNMALRKLGKVRDAEESIRDALAKAPDSSLSHTNLAWALLEQGKRKEALHHFQEALRLDPNSEYARNGMLEALRATFWPYRILMGMLRRLNNLPSGVRWGIMIGGLILIQQIGSIGDRFPILAPFTLPIIVAYVTFALSSWIAKPILNVALCCSRYGRQVLRPVEKRFAIAVGSLILVAIVLSGLTIWYETNPYLLDLTICLLLFTVLLSGLERCDAGWPRWAGIGICSASFLVVGIFGYSVVSRAMAGQLIQPAVVETAAEREQFTQLEKKFRPEVQRLKNETEGQNSEAKSDALTKLMDNFINEMPPGMRASLQARIAWRKAYAESWERSFFKLLLPFAIAGEIAMVWLGTVVVRR